MQSSLAHLHKAKAEDRVKDHSHVFLVERLLRSVTIRRIPSRLPNLVALNLK